MSIRNPIRPPKSPNMPLSPREFAPAFFDQLLRTVRGYYSQVDNAIAAIIGESGAQYIDVPCGLFYSTADQTLAAVDTGYAVAFDQTFSARNVSLVDGSKLTAMVAGVYSVQVSVQLVSSSAAAKTVYLWLSRSGTSAGYSTRVVTVTGDTTAVPVSVGYVIDLDVGEYAQVYWAADSTDIRLDAVTATAPHPGVASAYVVVSMAAPMPATRPTLP